MFKQSLFAATGIALLTTIGAAHAQVGAESPEAEDQEARQDTIVVTGQKIERSLQDTAVSVAVVTDLQIEEENIIDFKDVIDRTANISTRDGGRFVIRGIDSLNVSGAGQGDLATIYVDGTALPRQATIQAPAEIWDVEQIEIFRGPQSTLQGRASLAGAIIINTADPTFEWSGRARAIYTTEEERFRFGAALGGPIVEDQVAFRLAFETSESDGFGTNVTTGEPLDAVETLVARGKLLFEPEALPGLSVLLSYSHEDVQSGEDFASLLVDDPANNRVGFSNDPIQYDTTVDIATATVEYDLNDRWSLTSITGWNEVEYGFVFDDDRTAAPIASRFFIDERETWTQEARAQYAGDTLQGVFGVYLSKEDTPRSFGSGQLGIDLVNDLGVDLLLQAPPFSLDAATAGFVVSQYPNPSIIQTDNNLTQEIETYAAFTDFEWQFADQWTLFGGFRYDVEQQSNTTEALVTIETPLPDPALFSFPLNQVIAGVNGFLQAEASNATSPLTAFDSPEFGGFLPKFGIGYDIDDDKSVSFVVQRGYRSGGSAINTAQATAFEFDQEFIWNYELALRSLWMDGALTVNANAFYIDWTDQQVRVQLSNNVFDAETQNAGSSNVRGFELESRYAATETLDLYGSVGYAKTEFDEFIVLISGVETDFAGNEFAFAPQWTLNGGFTWRPTENWIANVNANHSTAAYIRADRPQTSRDSEARTLVNFRAGWENDTYGIYLTGANLLDEEYLQTQFPNDPIAGEPPEFAQFGRPQTFSIQLQARF